MVEALRGGVTFRNVRQPFVPSFLPLHSRALVCLPHNTCARRAPLPQRHALHSCALHRTSDLTYTLEHKLSSPWLTVKPPPSVRMRVTTVLKNDLTSVQSECSVHLSSRHAILIFPQVRLQRYRLGSCRPGRAMLHDPQWRSVQQIQILPGCLQYTLDSRPEQSRALA
jgi:hypothetical protein